MLARDIILILLALLPTAQAIAAPLVIADTSVSPHAVVRPIGVNETRWTAGFWADRLRVCRETSIPAMGELMRDSRYKPFYEHFLIAAGEAEGDYHGAAWNDGDFYKWIEAACSTLAVESNATLEAAADEAVRAVVAAQRADGYLHTPVLIRQRNGDATAEPFSDRHDFEVYNLGHLMTAGCVRFRASGKRDLLDAAERAAQFLEAAFVNPSADMARQAVCPAHYMGLVELYRTTRDKRYLRLAQRVVGLRNLAAGVDGGGGDDNQDRIPFVEQREAVGHAVRANYLYAGAADLYLETGDPSLIEPLEAVWRNVTQKKLYVTGACGALFDGASPYGSANQKQITRIHQAYGANYQLPSETAHNETCAALGAVLWNWRRFLATGEARHLDWIELAMHNAVLAGVSLEGTDYFYTNPLRVTNPPPINLRWSRARKPFIVSFCCPPNVVRTVAQLGGFAYSKSRGTVWVNLYGSNTLATSLDGQPIHLTQTTDYPWDGAVTIRLDKAPTEEFAFKLRQPSWADSIEVAVNGETTDVVAEDGFVTLRRNWHRGDLIHIHLPMPVVPLEAHPLVEETRNQIAVKRGPLVYCLESIDLPAGVRMEQVGLDPAGEFQVLDATDSLQGARPIETDLKISTAPAWQTLYRPAKGSPEQTMRAQLIPYYAWGNRGQSEMTVWLPRR